MERSGYTLQVKLCCETYLGLAPQAALQSSRRTTCKIGSPNRCPLIGSACAGTVWEFARSHTPHPDSDRSQWGNFSTPEVADGSPHKQDRALTYGVYLSSSFCGDGGCFEGTAYKSRSAAK